VRPVRPFGPGERLRILARTHRKIVIIDGKVGVTGGFGIWWSWMGNGLSPDEWRDSNVVVRGPAVYQMQVAFAQGWQEAGGPLLPADVFPSIAPQGSSSAAFVASEPRAEDTNAERLVQLAIASAHHRLWIANSYFIPSTAICDSLIRKAEQGVDVRILAPGRYMDIAPVRAAQRSTYDTLLSHGIRVWEYEISMMHAKTILVDDRLVVIGSTNMDPLSLRRNEEGALVVESPELAADLDRSWRVDLLHSREIRWDSWKKRGLVERFTRRLTSIIGSFL
jgi:cardiolipin synthase